MHVTALSSIFSILWHIFENSWIFIAITLFTSITKIFLAFLVASHIRNNKNIYIRRSGIFLILVLIGSTFDDMSWFLAASRILLFPYLSTHLYTLFIRIAWAFAVVKYHALALLIESLVEKNVFGVRQKILIVISMILFGAICVLAVLSLLLPDILQFNTEIFATKIILVYGLVPISLLSLFVTLSKLRTNNLPRILKMQIKVFVKTAITPFLLLESFNTYPFSLLRHYGGNKYVFASISALILVYAVLYCARKIIGLRFLNFKNQVETAKKIPLINNLRDVLEQFGAATNPRELAHITKNFFEQSFHIHPHKTHVYLRISNEQKDEPTAQPDQREIMVERFVETTHPASGQPPLFKRGVAFFLDDLAFDDFYNVNIGKNELLKLMYTIDADIFIPIVDQTKLVAYIIVDRNSRTKEFGSNNEFYDYLERDYMLIFSDYLGNIISLLQDGNFDQLLYQKKSLKDEVFFRHQEMNHYRESIHSFLRPANGREIGIIFYKNGHFVLDNKYARTFVPIDLNLHSGHPITKQLKKIVQQIIEYKTPQTCLIDDEQGKKIVASGIQNIERNNIIITLHRPEISDLLRKKTDLLNDPQDWGFFLCLETTKMGQLVDRFIPGYGEILLNFKIKLLKASLGTKALLLNTCAEDLIPIIELINQIGLRDQLHTIMLHEPVTSQDLAIKIFGIHTLLSASPQEIPLLERLNHSGTLFIQNIHFLDLETQEHLAEFIRCGVYRRLKTSYKNQSRARIICSSTKNLYVAVQEGTFSKNLFEELHASTLTMPSLATLAQDELSELIDSIASQILTQPTTGQLFCLNDREKQKLLNAHMPSLHELRNKIKTICSEKAKQVPLDNTDNQEYGETFNAARTGVMDEELIEAAQLGRHALKDKRIMGILWKKFQNQNKIAMFLGVNRSSVNRRCKEHGFIE
jgi:hypothetical protein